MASVSLSVSQSGQHATALTTGFSSINEDEVQLSMFQETYIFPLFAESFRRTYIPPVLYLIHVIIVIIHAILVGIFVGTKRIWEDPPIQFKIFHAFLDFYTIGQSVKEIEGQLIAGLLLYAFIVSTIIIGLGYFYINRCFLQWHLYLVRIATTMIFPAVFPVFASLFGNLCYLNNFDHDWESILFLVLYFVVVATSSLLLYNISLIQDYNITLIPSALSMWDSRVRNLLEILLGISCFAQPILDLLEEWMTVVAILLQMCCYLYLIYYLYFFPCQYFKWNAVATATIYTGLFCSFFSFIHLFTKDLISEHVYFFVPLGLGIISFVIVNKIYKKRRDKIIIKLSKITISDDEEMTELVKKEYFDDFVFTSTNDAVSYIHVGLEYHCDLFYDFSFLRYLLENYSQIQIVYAIAQMAALFPSELQFFSIVLNLISKSKKMNVGQHFILYQMKRIHVIRQSSVSKDASTRLSHLQKISSETISFVRSFWGEILNAKTDISFSSLVFLSRISRKAEHAFIDAMENFPNNTNMFQEFNKFQVEALGHYAESIVTAQKIYQLEQGKMLAVDYAFKAFINAFPNYIFHKILDCRGNFYVARKSNEDSMSNSNSDDSETFDDQFDEKNEELINQSFKQGKLRIALEKILTSISMYSLTFTTIVSIIQFICCLAVYIAIMTYIPINIDISHNIYTMSYQISDVAVKMDYNIIASSLIYFKDKHEFLGVHDLMEELKVPMEHLEIKPSLLVKTNLSIIQQTIQLQNHFIDAISSMLSEILFYDEYQQISADEIKFYEMNYVTNVDEAYLSSSRAGISIIIEKLFHIHQIRADNQTKFEKEIIDLLKNSLTITKEILTTIDLINEQGKQHTSDEKALLFDIIISVASLFLIIFIIPRSISMVMLKRDHKKASDMLRKVSEEDIQQSMKPILLKSTEYSVKGASIHGAHDTDYVTHLWPVVCCISLIAVVVIVLTASLTYISHLDIETQIYNLLEGNGQRYISALGSIISFFAEASNAMEANTLQFYKNSLFNKLLESHEILLGSVIDANKMFSLFLFSNSINRSVSATDIAMHMDTNSINDRFNTVVTLIRTIQAKDSVNLTDHEFSKLFYLFNTYVFDDFTTIQQNIILYADYLYASGMKLLNSLASVGIVISFIVFVLEMIFIFHYNLALRAIGQLLAMLPPKTVVQKGFIMNFIHPKHNKNKNVQMSAAQTILTNFSSAVIVTDAELIIQTVNNALRDITGFMPDQMLGQHIDFLVPPPNKSNVHESNADDCLPTRQVLYSIINEMKNRSSESEDENETIKIKIMTENGQRVIVRATIICIRDKLGVTESFCLTLRDVSVEQNQKLRLKEAKQRSDKLISCLIPPQVLSSIKGTNKSTLFYSEKATVIFIELTGLTFYVHTMSPSQMINNLNIIYNKFDDVCHLYSAIHSLKMNDDLFVACSGLFDFKEDYKTQVMQAVDFSLDILEKIEDVNEQLDIDVQLRIGINIGGPLVGSVLDPHTPTFDILGGLIGLAVKMQSDGPTGVVQVSKNVLEYLDQDKYRIEEGEVLMGARGVPDPTYIVSPLQDDQ